jgi:hypothetical protein
VGVGLCVKQFLLALAETGDCVPREGAVEQVFRLFVSGDALPGPENRQGDDGDQADQDHYSSLKGSPREQQRQQNCQP